MVAYVIAQLHAINDPEGLQEYRRGVAATREAYGGRLVTGRGRLEVLEGDGEPQSVTILEFPSYEQAKRWYESAEYQPLKALRQRSARGTVLLIEGN